MKRFGQDFDTVTRSKTTFADPRKWKEPLIVFTCSMSDFLHPAADAWRDEAWEIIADTPHTYMILTKRIERWPECAPKSWGQGWPNVVLGVSVENQRFAHRADLLNQIPSIGGRFISAEPLLGPLSLYTALRADERGNPISLVITGGESGHDPRPMDLAWARRLRDECRDTGTKFDLKQLGGWPDARAHDKALLDGVTHHAMIQKYMGGQLL
jgi:protein gp37